MRYTVRGVDPTSVPQPALFANRLAPQLHHQHTYGSRHALDRWSSDASSTDRAI